MKPISQKPAVRRSPQTEAYQPARTARRMASALGTAAMLLLGMHAVQAANNDAWGTGPTNANFTGNNWTLGTTTPGGNTGTIAAGDILYFGTSSTTTLTDDETAGFSLGGFTFNAGAAAFTIGGNSFALGGGITNNGTNLETINDAFTMAAQQTFTTNTGGGNLTLSGAISGAGSIIAAGTGTLNLTGPVTLTGGTSAAAPTLLMNATGTTVNLSGTGTNINSIGVGYSGANNTLNITGGTTALTNAANGSIGLAVGTAGGSGVVNQTGGSVTISNNLSLGNQGGGYGNYNLSSGALSINGMRNGGFDTNGSVDSGGYSLFNQSGGTVGQTGNTVLGRGATTTTATNVNVMNLSGGTFTQSGNNLFLGYSAGSVGILNVSGGTLFNTSGNTIQLNNGNTAATTSILNLNGGTVQTNGITNLNTTGTAIVNFNGGTLQANAASTTFFGTNNFTNVNIFSGGATIDTQANAITIGQALLAPAGSGLSSITVGSGGGAGYIGAPIVNITGGGGTGATAVANINSSGVVTGFTITSPGTGYTSAPTVTLYGGGATTAATATAGAPTANTSGGLTKIGTGNLTLSGINTYTGGTTVSNGTLTLNAGGGSGAVRGVVNVNSGATLLLSVNNALGYNAGSQVTTVNINGGTVNTTGALSDEGYITSFNLTGGTLAYTGSNASNAYQFNAGDASAPGITSNASATTSTISGGLNIRSGTLGFNVASGTTPSGIDLLVSGVISAGYGINKTNAGVMALTNANTYTGTTTISAGTLELGNGGTTGTLVTSSAITDNGTFAIDRSNAVTQGTDFSTAAITGTGGLTQAGAGNTTLNVTNTYTGATVINAGTLTLTNGNNGGGSLSGTPTITVNSGGTLVLTNQDTLGYTAGKEALVINSGGLVQNNGTGKRDTLQNTLTMTGGILGGSSVGDGIGAFSLDAQSGNTITATSDASGNAALINASSVNLQVGNEIFNVTHSGTAASDLTISSVMNGGNGFTKTGNGILTLSGANIYTGATAVSAGTLALTGSLAGSSVSTSGTGTITEATAGVIGGTGTTLTQGSTGTSTLSGANTYTGATAVNAGTLALGSGGSLANTAVTVGNTSTFAVKPGVASATNALGGSLTLNAGSNFTMQDGAINTFNVTGASTLAPATAGIAPVLSFDLSGTNGVTDLLNFSGAATNTTNVSVAFDALGALTTNNTYTFLTAGSGLTSADFTLASNRVAFGNTAYNLSLSGTATSETVTIGSSGIPTVYYDGLGGATALNATNGGTTNFSTDAAGTMDAGGQPSLLSDVNFTATNVTTPQTIASLGQSYNVNSVNFLSGAPAITLNAGGGTGQTLTVNGNGITNAGTNNQTLNVPIVLGTVSQSISNTGAGILTLGGTVSNGGFNLTTAGTGAVNISGVISGTGGLINTGVTTLSGNSSYTGTTTINAGTLKLTGGNNGSGGALSGTPTITVNSGGTLVLTNADTLGYTSGKEALVINSGGLVQNNGTAVRDTLQNTLTMTGGTLGGTSAGDGQGLYSFDALNAVTATSDAAGNAALISASKVALQAGNEVFNVTHSGTAASDLTINSQIIFYGGGSGLTKTGNGILTLTGASTYGGTTTINAGTLALTGSLNGTAISSAATFNESSAGSVGGASSLTVTGGTTTLSGANTYTGATLASAGTLNLTGSLTGSNVSTSGTGTITEGTAGVIGGTGTTLTQGSTGTSTLSGANTYTGATNISAGTLTLSGSLTGTTITNAATFTETGAGGIAGASSLTNTAGTTTLGDAANSFTGNIAVNGGTVIASAGTTTANTALGSDTPATNRTITVGTTGATPTTGILSFTINDVFGTNTAANIPAITVNSGSQLTSTRFNTIGAITLNGATLYQNSTDGGTITSQYQGYQFSGGVTVPTGGGSASTISAGGVNGDQLSSAAGGTTFTVGQTGATGGDLLVSSRLTDSSAGNNSQVAGSLTKAGAGTMVLTAVNNYSGGTTVNAGTLALNAASADGSGAITINTGGTVTISAPTTSAGVGSALGSGGVILAGGTLKNAPTFTATSAAGDTSQGNNIQNGGLLTLTAGTTSILDFGAGNTGAVFSFSGLSDTSTGNTVLNVYDWSGGYPQSYNPNTLMATPGSDGGDGLDQLFIGSGVGTGTALTTAQLKDIHFFSDAGTTSLGNGMSVLLNDGEISPAPEPAEVATLSMIGLGLGGLLLRARKRRMTATPGV